MREFGLVLLIAGLCGTFYFALMFDTSVEVPETSFMEQTIGGDRVNNLGLMADRQNGIIVSLGIAVIGTLMMLFAPKTNASPTEKKCPFCAELIKAEATVCRFCNRDLTPVTTEQTETIVPDADAPGSDSAEALKKGQSSDATFWIVLMAVLVGVFIWIQSV